MHKALFMNGHPYLAENLWLDRPQAIGENPMLLVS